MTRVSDIVGRGDGIRGGHALTGTEELEIGGPKWFALFTMHQHEQKVVERLRNCEIESFVPTYEEKRIWKDRHQKTLTLPLFPTYVFARLDLRDFARIYELASVRRVVGNSKGPTSLSEKEVEFLRSDYVRTRIRPYKELVVGRKVRVVAGVMAGVEGVLVREDKGLKFVLSVPMINQHAAIHVSAADLEALF